MALTLSCLPLLSCSDIKDDDDDSSAILWLELRPTDLSSSILLAIIYLRPPVSSTVLDKLQTSISTAQHLLPTHQPMLLLGDFNLRHQALGDTYVTQSSREADQWIDFLDKQGLSTLNHMLPAHSCTRPSTHSMLDLAITNQAGEVLFNGMRTGIDGLVSDHEAISITCNHLSIPDTAQLLQSRREIPRIDWKVGNMTDKDWAKFTAALRIQLQLYFPFSSLSFDSNPTWSAHNPTYVIESAYTHLINCIHDAAQYSIGVKERTERSVHWMGKPGVKQAYARMVCTHRGWQQHYDNPSHKQQFEQAQAEWRRVKQEAKQQSWKELCESLQSKVRSPVIWSTFRRTCPSTFSSLSSFPDPVTGALPSSLPASLNHVASAFVSSGQPPVPLPDPIQRETEECIQAEHATHPSHLPDESDHWQFDIKRVEEQCQYQHTDTAAGPDSIAALMLTHGGEMLYRALSLLYSYSWHYSVLPQAWRAANVCALYKGKGSKSSIGSFRPISVTSVIVRTFEHLIHHQLAHRLERQDYFHPEQFGFRHGRSTQDALMYLHIHLRRYLAAQRKQPVPVAFLDLKKAFDRVNPHRLLFLLSQRAGVNGKAWCWIRSFLSGRQIRTVHQGTCSDWHDIYYGVPQGSVLSPLLFLVFIQESVEQMRQTIPESNHIHSPASLLDCVHVIFYADDIAIFPRLDLNLPFPEWSHLFHQSLNCLTTWAANNQMEFSADKSNIVFFARSNKSRMAHRTLSMPWSIGGFRLIPSDTYTYLGLLHHRTLTWKPHFDRVLARATSDAYLISRLIQPDAPPHFPGIRALCMGYLRPRCTYALALWRPNEHQLHQLQSRFLRPMLRLLHLPWCVNHLGVMVEANCPSLSRYRQAQLHQLVIRAGQLPAVHPIRQLWGRESHVSWEDQHRPTLPSYLHSIGVEAYHMYRSTPSWSTCIGPHAASRTKQHSLELTHQDWLAVPHRDPLDPTPLRLLKPRPGRSIYLYHEPNRDSCTLRARLRLNRAGTQINADRGTATAGPGLCLSCSQRNQQAIPDSVQHLVVECAHYRSARQRLAAQLFRIPVHGRPPADPPPALSLPSILGQPNFDRGFNTQQRTSRWATWLTCTGNFLRSISHTRIRMGLSAL